MLRTRLVWISGLAIALGSGSLAVAQTPTAQPTAVRKIGTIKAIQNGTIRLSTDAGEEVSIEAQSSTRVVRVPPGEKDLKNAVPSQLADLQVGDRILAAGHATDPAGKLLASSIVVMKLEDVKTSQQRNQEDWQKRGTGGVVKSVDAATGTISIAGSSPGGEISLRTSNKTIFHRYSVDSEKYEDAKPGTIHDIKAGDQLRVRGNRSADGKEIAAEEIVSGLFRDLSGMVGSLDAGAGTFSIKDLQSKKSFVVKVTAESRMLQVPAAMAERIATRLKSAAGGPVAPTGPAADTGNSATSGAGTSGRAPDFQQMLSHLPAIQFADLHAGDAVLVLTTQGDSERVTAVTLLSGVEPILRASPNSGQAINLGSWSLGSSSGEGP